ncbi:MAG: prolyl oligopeptidase family serine peptidase [Halobacteriales archaeon]
MHDTLSLDDYHALTVPKTVRLSPDGDRAAIIARESVPDADEHRSTLLVVPTDGETEPHRLTRASEASDPRWNPDGTRLAFRAARRTDTALTAGPSPAVDDDESGSEDSIEDTDTEPDPESQVWMFDLARGGDARQLTDFEEGVRDFDWGPDGERLVVSARDPTPEQRSYLEGIRDDDDPYEVTRLQHKQDGDGFLDDVVTYLFVIRADAEGASRTDASRLDDAYGRGAFEPSRGLSPAWGPGNRIAYAAYYGEQPDRTYALDVHTITPDGLDRRTLTAGDVTATGLRWSPDGRHLAYVAAHPTNFHRPTEIHVADPDAGVTWTVSASLDRTVGRGGTAEWIDETTLLAPVGDEGRTRLVRLDATEDAPERVFDAQGTGRTVTAFDATLDTTAVVFSDPTAGQDVFAIATDAIGNPTDPVRLTSLNTALLDGIALPTCTRVHFENPDGETIEGLVYLPPDFEPDISDPLPLICHIHGGPIAYDAPRFQFEYGYWTGHGYAVLNVNYRGSSSYGQAFSECIRGEWGPREAADILAGVDHVIDRGWADPDRLFVSGFSQGGINTLYVLTRDDRFAAAAPEHGIYDFYSNFGTADMHQWYVNDVGVPWENEAAYRAMSSIRDIDQVETPMVITAGENDWRCPPSQAEQLYISAKRAGIDSKLVVYQDEHHNISRPGRQIHRLETLTGWFQRHDPATESPDSTT